MQNKQSKTIFSHFSGIFLNEAMAKKPKAEMRVLSDEELHAVAGGPELEVSNGN